MCCSLSLCFAMHAYISTLMLARTATSGFWTGSACCEWQQPHVNFLLCPTRRTLQKSPSFAVGCSLASIGVVHDTKKSPLELEVNESSSARRDSSKGKDFKTNNKKLSQQKLLYSGVNFKAHTVTWLHTERLSCNGTYRDVCMRSRNIWGICLE